MWKGSNNGFVEYTALKNALDALVREGNELYSSSEESASAMGTYLGSMKFFDFAPAKTTVNEYQMCCRRLAKRNAALIAGIGNLGPLPVIYQKLKKERGSALKLQEIAEQSKVRGDTATVTEKRIEAANVSRDNYRLLEAEARGRIISAVKGLLSSFCGEISASASDAVSMIEKAELAVFDLQLDETEARLDALRQSLADLEH
jgi:hypothetical protein